MPSSPLKHWRLTANEILSPIERVKDRIRESISTIRARWPEWEKSGDDARWAWFTGAKKILQTYQLSSVCIRDHLTQVAWWKEHSFEVDEVQIPDHLKEFSVLQLNGLSNGIFTITEESLRLIVSRIDPSACSGRRGKFKSIYDFLLARLVLEKHAPLFDLHRLIRNTIHTNGVFRPRNERDVTVVFDGERFHFRNGRKLTFVNIRLLLRIVEHYNVAIMEIVSSEEVSRLASVARFAEVADNGLGDAT